MSRRARPALALVTAVVAAWLALPRRAAAHAYLVKTVPAASVVLNSPPPNIQLTYDEAVEPRFAIISVTNVDGHQETTGPVHRSPSNPDTLVVPLRPNLPEGWYLIYWRAISVDGHPVNGFFTYAVGPNPGPAPQFRIPNISATATTPQLLITRWAMFVFVMAAIGLFVMRLLVARPVVRAVEGVSLKAVSVAFGVSAALGLIAIPVYLDVSTANDSLRSAFDLTALVPLYRVTAFGRAMVDLELCFALFCVAAAVALWVDRPDRAAPVGGRVDRIVRRAARGCGGADRPGRGRARRADLPARADVTVRLAAPRVGLGVARRTGRPARAVVDRVLPRAGARAVGDRSPLLERSARLGARARRHRDRRGDRAHAGGQRAVGDELRSGDPGQGGTARRRDADRVGQPAAVPAAADRRTAASRASASPRRGCCAGSSVARSSSSSASCSLRPCSRASLRLLPRSRSRTRRSRR